MFFLGLTLLASAITADGFRACSSLTIENKRIPSKIHSLQKRDLVFVNTSYLDFFFESIFPLITDEFILISSGGFGAVDSRYEPFLNDEKLLHWFGAHLTIKHPKATCIPLGASWISKYHAAQTQSYLDQLTLFSYFEPKPIYIYINWSDHTHLSRREIRNHFTSFPDVFISKRLLFPRYIETLSRSRFVISPRGVNIDCFRNWETLYAGSIPVIESHGIDPVFTSLPAILVDDLSKVTEEFLEEEFQRLKSENFDLERLHLEYWLSLILSRKAGTY